MEEGLYIVTVLGRDEEGLVSMITKTLSETKVNIVDIEQSVIHGLFSMFMLIDLKKSETSLDSLKKRLSFSDISLKIVPVSEYDNFFEKEEKDLRKITILGKDKPGIVYFISKALTENKVNIEKIKMVARGDLLAMEMFVNSSGISLSDLRYAMESAGSKVGVDVIVQSEKSARSRKRLVVFDMDGTIVDEEIIDELAKVAGVGKAVSEITAKGMSGEMDFEESLKKRIELLKGLPEEVLSKIRDEMRLTPGTEELIFALKSMGYKIALISGGFTYFTDALKERLGFDYAYGNELVIKDGRVSGEIRGQIIDSKRKADIMVDLAKKEKIERENIVAVGDGANDQIMIENAGLGIAFNAKDVLKKAADGNLTKNNIKGLMYCLGVSEKDFKKEKN